jgi:hypothetical protein
MPPSAPRCDALEVIVSEGRRSPNASVVHLALDYLDALIPAGSDARQLLLDPRHKVNNYPSGRWSSYGGTLAESESEFELVVDAGDALRRRLNVHRPNPNPPPSQRRRTRQDRRLAPSEQRLARAGRAGRPRPLARASLLPTAAWTTPVTSVLEQTVILYRDREPVAEVHLATLFAWACDSGRRRHRQHRRPRLGPEPDHTVHPSFG